ncbi:MAG: hypothetical protein ACFB10_12300 [Salibacteraceae bacterium]
MATAEILETLRTKTRVKQDVYDRTLSAFRILQRLLSRAGEEYAQTVADDQRVKVNYSSEGEQHAKLVFGGDTLIFHMHTNVFLFHGEHDIWKLKYLKEDPYRAYCGVIHVYNFLSDSFHYQRMNDLGYLVARIFINKEGHFFVESKQTEKYGTSSFGRSKTSEKSLNTILEAIVQYSLDFELLAPPYDAVQEVSVQVMQNLTFNMRTRTGKRLGFQFKDSSTALGDGYAGDEK